MSELHALLAHRRGYLLWLATLATLIALGIDGYALQRHNGLMVTGMSDQVVWGLYIGNFTFLVGLAASAVLLVIPAYLLNWPAARRVTLPGECMAIAAVTMSLLFVMADLGQPARIWHALPFIGRLNHPASILAWDIAILTAYLLLNIGLVTYLLLGQYRHQPRQPSHHFPWILLAIVMGIGIHTVTAFMLSGLPARPLWHSAVIAPRFIASAFASGSALLILLFGWLDSKMRIIQSPVMIRYLTGILLLALWIDLFLFGSELFVLFYRPTAQGHTARHLYFDWLTKTTLTPWVWSAIAVKATIALLLASRFLRQRSGVLYGACLPLIPAIMVEKGIGLVVPGFQPTPLGELVEYAPTLVEMQIAVGIWAIGLLLFTWLIQVVVAVDRASNQRHHY